MNVLSLRAETQDLTAEQVVRRFFDYLSRRDLKAARSLVAKGFSWFGQPMSEERWVGETLASFLSGPRLRVGRMRPLSLESARALPVATLEACFGGLSLRDRIHFVDVTRGELTATVIVVTRIEDRKQKIVKLIDPEPFAELIGVSKTPHLFALSTAG